jgi:multisubunit Na+/H+ antiporter MnhF subunit
VNGWLIAAAAASVALGPCAWVCVRASLAAAVAAYLVAGSVAVAVLMLLAEGLARPVLWDLAIVAAAGQVVGGLAFARYLGGELWRLR